MPLFSQELIIAAMRGFGHDAKFEGVCAGLSTMYGNALVADKEQEFLDRCNKIASPAFQNQIKQINQLTLGYLRNNLDATREEEQAFRDNTARTLLGQEVWIEMQAFFNGIMLYQYPREQQEILKGFPTQGDILKIANLTESIALEKKGGLAEISTYFGIHTDEELASLFNDLKEILQDYSVKGFEIAHLLESPGHRIAFKHTEKKGWCVVDPNSLTHEFIRNEDIVKHFKRVFRNTPHLAIGLISLTTKQNPQLGKLREKFQGLLAKHLVIDKTTAHRTDSIEWSLLHLAAANNRPDILQHLIQCGADLKLNNAEIAPIVCAIEGNHPDCVRLLMEHNVRHTKIMEDDPNCTTLSLSVKQGREEIVEILLKNPQALETANFYELLRKSIKGESSKTFKSLTEHLLNDPEQVKQADFQDLSNALIEHEGKEKMLQIFLDQSEIIKEINSNDLLSSAVERGNGGAVAVLLSHPAVLPHIDIKSVWDDALDFGNPKVIIALLNQTNVMAQVDFQDLFKKAIDYAVNYDSRLDGLQSFIEHAVKNNQNIGKIDFALLQAQAENDPNIKRILDQFEKDYAQKAKENLLIRETTGDYHHIKSESNSKWGGMIEKEVQAQTVSTANGTQAANDEPNKSEQDHGARSRRFSR